MLLETTPRTPQTQTVPSSFFGPRLLLQVMCLLVVTAALVAWAVVTYRGPGPPYGDRAVVLFPLFILLVDLGAQWLAYRSLRDEGIPLAPGEQKQAPLPPLSLPQVALPLYLAC
jgi:hypothetical protein